MARDNPDAAEGKRLYLLALAELFKTFQAASRAPPPAPAPPAGAAVVAAPAGGGAAAAQLPTASSQDEEYWTLLDGMRHFKQHALKYITTLRKSIADEEERIPGLDEGPARQQAIKKRDYFKTVERYCAEFTRRCDDSRQSYQVQPNLANLKDMEKLLAHIVKNKKKPPKPKPKPKPKAKPKPKPPKAEAAAQPPAPPAPPAPAISPEEAERRRVEQEEKDKIKRAKQAWKLAVQGLSWDPKKIRNRERQYSYGTWDVASGSYVGVFKAEPALRCNDCHQWFFRSDLTPGLVPATFIDFQKNYQFCCRRCGPEERFEMSDCENWIDAIQGAMAYKTWTEQRKLWKLAEVRNFIEEHWATLCIGRGEMKPNWDPAPFFTRNKNKVVVHVKPHWELFDPRPEAERDGTGAALQPCNLLKDGGTWSAPPAKPKPKPRRRKPKPKEPAVAVAHPWGGPAEPPPPPGLQKVDSVMDGMQPIESGGAAYDPTEFGFEENWMMMDNPLGPAPQLSAGTQIPAMAFDVPVVPAQPGDAPPDDPFGLPGPGFGPPIGAPLTSADVADADEMEDFLTTLNAPEVSGAIPQPSAGASGGSGLGPGQISSSPVPAAIVSQPVGAPLSMDSFMAPVGEPAAAAAAAPKSARGPGGAAARESIRQQRRDALRQANKQPKPAYQASTQLQGLNRQPSTWLPFTERLFSQSSNHVTPCRVCKQGSRMLGNESFNSRVCLACEDPERYGTQCYYKTIPKEQQTYRAFITLRSSASVKIPYEVHLCDKHYAHFESSGEDLTWSGPHRSDNTVQKERKIPLQFFELQPWSDPKEKWVKCEACGEECHHCCVLFNPELYKQSGNAQMLCPNPTCRNHGASASRAEDRQRVQRLATSLQQTPLGRHLEEEVSRQVFSGGGSEKITIRLISNVEREQLLPQAIRERYNITDQLRYQQKYLMAFVRNPDDTDVAFFAMQVLEYSEGSNLNMEQYQNCAYIAYIESIALYHLPQCAVNQAGQVEQACSCPRECNRERSAITKAIFQGYLRYLQIRQFRRAYLWAMAPNSLDSDFLFHMRPRDTRAMQAPDQERQQNLEKWYKDRLGTAKEAGIITGFFHNAVDEQAQRNSASEGAMFHGAQAEQPAAKRPKGAEAEEDTSWTGRKRKATEQFRPDQEAKRPQMETGASASMSKLMVFPGDTATETALNDALTRKKKTRGGGAGLERAESRSVTKRFMKRINAPGNGSHFVCHFAPSDAAAAIEDDPTVNIDDESREKTLNDRENLVGLCTVKNYQFDTMRMGKFSTMMLLQHLLFPKFAPELTHRPVLSRQRSSRHVTAEQANAWHLIEQLSSEDDVDRQMLQALRPRLEEAEHWDAVAKAHSESLQAGEAKSARVVKLVQHASQLVCARALPWSLYTPRQR